MRMRAAHDVLPVGATVNERVGRTQTREDLIPPRQSDDLWKICAFYSRKMFVGSKENVQKKTRTHAHIQADVKTA